MRRKGERRGEKGGMRGVNGRERERRVGKGREGEGREGVKERE